MPEVQLGHDAVTSEHVETTLAELGNATSICLGNHWDKQARVGLIAGALLGTYRHRHLAVKASDNDAVAGALRFGVATALARRSQTLTFCESATNLRRSDLARVWTAGSRTFTEAMFADSAGVDADVGARHVTFVNPHLSSSSEGHADVVFLLRRWLSRRLKESLNGRTRSLTDDVAQALTELVGNVGEHAGAKNGPAVDCLVRVAIDDDAIRCAVIDNGQGIVSSVEGKAECDNPRTFLRSLLAGDVPRWHGGRGIGLPKVAEVMQGNKGSMRLATGALRAAVEARDIEVCEASTQLDGVIAELTFPVL